MEDRIRTFLTWGRRYRRWADSTCGGYRRRVSSWLAWCEQAGVRDTRATSRDVQAWLDTLHPTPAVRSHAHTALQAFCDWQVHTAKRKANPVRQVERVPVRRSIPRSLEIEAVQAVLAAAAAHGAKWSCYMGLLAFAGLRRAEACQLRWVDIEGADAWLRVLGKGGQEAVVPIHDDLRRLIVRWRSELADPVWMFPGRYPGEHMSVASATGWTRRIFDEAGLPDATGHWLRHAFARRLVEKGVTLPDVMGATRHQSLSSVTIYTRSRPHQVAAAVAQLDW